MFYSQDEPCERSFGLRTAPGGACDGDRRSCGGGGVAGLVSSHPGGFGHFLYHLALHTFFRSRPHSTGKY